MIQMSLSVQEHLITLPSEHILISAGIPVLCLSHTNLYITTLSVYLPTTKSTESI
jgi:hypothetical protein